MGHPVRINGSDVARALSERSREPFIEELKRVLEAAPSDQALRKFAARHPDRWSQIVSTMARLSGYTDKTESLSLNFFMDLRSKSDMEIEQALREEMERIQGLLGKDTLLIEGEVRPNSSDSCEE